MNKPVCLVTGANGRLGSALCAQLACEYDLVAVYRSGQPPAGSQMRRRVENPLSCSLYGKGKSGLFAVKADLSVRQQIGRVVELSLAKFGRVDAIVNAAADTKFHGKLTELWDGGDYPEKQLYVTCVAPFQLASAVHQALWKDEPEENARWNRSVINISSVSALQVGVNRGQAYYSASKSAMKVLTLFLAKELAPYSVRVNGLCPARFTDEPATAKVVTAVAALLRGKESGIFQ